MAILSLEWESIYPIRRLSYWKTSPGDKVCPRVSALVLLYTPLTYTYYYGLFQGSKAAHIWYMIFVIIHHYQSQIFTPVGELWMSFDDNICRYLW